MRQPATMICYLPHAFYYKWIYIYASQLNLSVFRCAFDMIILVLQHPRPKQNGKQKCGFTRRICKKANLNGKQICFNSNCFSVKKLNKPKVLIHFPKCMASIVNLVCLVGPLVLWSLNEFKFYAVHSNLKCRGVSYLPKQKCNQILIQGGIWSEGTCEKSDCFPWYVKRILTIPTPEDWNFWYDGV